MLSERGDRAGPPRGWAASGLRDLSSSKKAGLLEACLEVGLSVRAGSSQDLLFELLDLLGQRRELSFDVSNTAQPASVLVQVLAGALRRQ